ncbi:MAG: IclR family transcriptional regulator [Pseudomonadota bacterium]
MPDDTSQRSEQIPTNLRLLVLLEEVARAGVPVTPSALKDKLKLPKPTLHRLFNTAEAEGYLQRDIDGRSYSPGPRLRRLAVNTMSAQRIRTVRLNIMRHLAADVGETCNLATPDRDGMTYLDRVETHWPLRIQLPIGTRVPFYCTASGKLYLSSLRPGQLEKLVRSIKLEPHGPGMISSADALIEEVAEIRKRGHATDNQEFMVDMVAIAVPILDDQNLLVSTLSVHAPTQRHSLKTLARHLDRLKLAASDLAALIGG